MGIAATNLRLFFPAYWQAQQQALKLEKRTAEEIKAIQNNKLMDLLKHAKAHSPFFKDYPTIASMAEIARLPIMSKDTIRAHTEAIKANNYPESALKKNSTSGSSGDALHFYSDVKLDPMRQAIGMRGNYWAGYTFGQPMLLLWGSVADVNKAKQLKTKLAHSPFLFNQKMLSSFDMKVEDMLEHTRQINQFKPTLLIGYPSSLEVFSEFLIRRGIQIHKPNGIIASGETLFEPQRQAIEKAFGCKVMNRYGSRELGNIANECQHQKGLHIHQDHVIVEILNEHQQSCKIGELGEIVVTDLNNLGFPMIRYRIGDLGVLSDKPCTCGRPFDMLERVEGRCFDLVVGANGNRVPGNYFTLYFRKFAGIEQFQVRQDKDLNVHVLLIPTPAYTTTTEQKIRAGLKDKLGEESVIKISVVDAIAPTASGKHRWVISEASPFVQ